jgi:hypothetical protein
MAADPDHMLNSVFATALTNAKRSMADIARSNADRRELAPVEHASAGPGDIQRLGRDECVELLGSRRFGRFAYVESARALDVVPVNYVCRADGSVVFRSGPGPKLSAADRRDVVAFQVDDIDEDSHTGWSVLVVGRARRLSHGEVSELSDLPQPWANGPRYQFVLVQPTRIEGRRLT